MQLADLLFIMTADLSHLSIFLKGCFECDDLGKFNAHLSTASVVLKRLASKAVGFCQMFGEFESRHGETGLQSITVQ